MTATQWQETRLEYDQKASCLWKQKQHHNVATQAGAAAEQRAAAPHPHPVHPCGHHLQETGGRPGGGLTATEDT